MLTTTGRVPIPRAWGEAWQAGMSERVAIGEARAQSDKDKAAERKAEGWKKRGKKQEPGGNLPPGLEEGKSRDTTAVAVGMSYKTYEKAKAVVQAATAAGPPSAPATSPAPH